MNLRYAVRTLARSPGFTAVAILTLALGIGANTAVFSVVQAVLLRSLPFPHADRLVQLWETGRFPNGRRGPVSPWNFEDWRRSTKIFDSMSAYGYKSFTLTGRGDAEVLNGATVTPDFLQTLGVGPAIGTGFASAEERSGTRVGVLSWSAFQNRFGGDESVVGSTVTLNDEPVTIVGIMPEGFGYPSPATALWVTPAYDLSALARGDHFLFAVGRVAPGVSLPAAQAELDAIAGALAAQYADTNREMGIAAVPLRDAIVGTSLRSALFVLWGAVGLVLLVAAANAANLLLVRAQVRRRELAVRAALGAGRGRLALQLLTESAILAVAGGALGVLLAWGGTKLLLAGGNRVIPALLTVQVDGTVLAFTALVSVATGLLFGTLPALWFARQALSGGGAARVIGGAFGGVGGDRLRSALAAAEVALALTLVVGAGLLMQSFWRLRHVDTGFDASALVTLRIGVPESRYPQGPKRAAFYQAVADSIAQVPGVTHVGAVNDLPFSGSRTNSSFELVGSTLVADSQEPSADTRTVNPDYFPALGVRLVSGRLFTAEDDARARGVVVVNETLAGRYFPPGKALGSQIRIRGRECEVIGVVADAKHDDLAAPSAAPTMYLALAQEPTPPWSFFAARVTRDPTAMLRLVRAAAQDVDHDVPAYDVQSMERRLDLSVSTQRLDAALLSVFGALAVSLAAIGIFGVVNYAVAQQTREIGVRIALGAAPRRVLRLVLVQGLKFAGAGIIVGIAASLALTRVLASLLYGIQPTDVATFAGAAALLAAVAMLACWLPAHRAAKLDPMVALRQE